MCLYSTVCTCTCMNTLLIMYVFVVLCFLQRTIIFISMEANTCMWEQLVAEVATASGCTYDIAMGLSVSCCCYLHTCKDNLSLWVCRRGMEVDVSVENLFCKHINTSITLMY